MKDSLINYIFGIDRFSHFKSLIVSLLIVGSNIAVAICIKLIIDANNYSFLSPVKICFIVAVLLIFIDFLSIWLIKIRSSLNKSVVITLNHDLVERIKKNKENVDQGYLLTSIGQDSTLIGSFSSEIWRSLIPGVLCLAVFSIYLWYKYTMVTSVLIVGSILPLVFLPVLIQKKLSYLYDKTKASNDDLNNILTRIIDNVFFLKTVGLKGKSLEILKENFKQASKKSAVSSSAMLFLYSISFNNTILPITFVSLFMYIGIIPGNVGDFFELVWIIQLFSGYIVGIPTAFSQYINAKTSFLRLHNLKIIPEEEKMINAISLAEKLRLLRENYLFVENTKKIDWHLFLPEKFIIEDTSVGHRGSWILEGSIRDNIGLGNESNDSEIENAMSLACLTKSELKINSLDEISIKSSGENLSHGQKARLILARMIFMSKNYNYIDGLISTLDTSTAEKIVCNIKTLPGKWCIFEKSKSHINGIDSFRVVKLDEELAC